MGSQVQVCSTKDRAAAPIRAALAGVGEQIEDGGANGRDFARIGGAAHGSDNGACIEGARQQCADPHIGDHLLGKGVR